MLRQMRSRLEDLQQGGENLTPKRLVILAEIFKQRDDKIGYYAVLRQLAVLELENDMLLAKRREACHD